MKSIQKLKLINFKRFQSFAVNFDEHLNVIIGDNEAGKSTVLTAIDLVLSASRSKVENIGLDYLINHKTVDDFLSSDKKYENLPRLLVELYLNEQENPDLNGRNNTDIVCCDGLRMVCEPNAEMSKEIAEVLKQNQGVFPYEFYSISFKTFSGEPYSGYKRCLKHIFIDNTQTSSEYALKEYIKDIYNSKITDKTEKFLHQNKYRKHKEIFKETVLSEINNRLDNYSFAVKTNSKSNLETDLTLLENDVCIENKGKGKQCFIKTDFALSKCKGELNVVLMEEPENHLSHINMKRLIQRIDESEDAQLFIATHNSLISSRLDLRKAILVNSRSDKLLQLKDLPEETAKYFMKASNNNILEFILSDKVILVEGDAEYILMEAFFKIVANEKPEDSKVHIISVGGTSFKRYLDIAKLLDIKTAVIRDNDKDYLGNCVNNYLSYKASNIEIFSDTDSCRYTFEIAFYYDNKKLCDDLFSEGRRTLSVKDYMLNNKADVAFTLLDKKAEFVQPPQYIKDAIEWIRK